MKTLKEKREELENEYNQVYENVYVKYTVKALIAAVSLIVIFLVALNLSSFVVPKASWMNFVQGHSMDPNLHNHEIVFTSSDPNISAGDIVISHIPAYGLKQYPEKEGTVVIKRVVGVPGDRLIINEDGSIVINGEIYDEPYLSDEAKAASYDGNITSVLLKEDEYFLMGDNRANSYDSRYFGVVNRSDILYKEETKPTLNFWLKLVMVVCSFTLAFFTYYLVEYILTECAYGILKNKQKKNNTI